MSDRKGLFGVLVLPNRVKDMTQAQRELLGMMTDPAQKIADSTRRDHLGPFTDPEKFAE